MGDGRYISWADVRKPSELGFIHHFVPQCGGQVVLVDRAIPQYWPLPWHAFLLPMLRGPLPTSDDGQDH